MARQIAGMIGGGVIALSATAALAFSVALSPGAGLVVPATTAASELTLDGVVVHDDMVPLSITTPSGAVLCEGQLQDRVVQSNKTGRFDFYYAIRDTKGLGAINRLVTTSFAGQPIHVAFRTDGLGTVPPNFANRSAAPGAMVQFRFTNPPVSCAQHQESRFILINVKAFNPGGKTQLISTTGPGTTVPSVTP